MDSGREKNLVRIKVSNKKAIRRKRRQNIISFIVLFASLGCICGGVYFGSKMLFRYMDETEAENGLSNVRSAVIGGYADMPDDASDLIRQLMEERDAEARLRAQEQGVPMEEPEEQIEVSEEYLARLTRRIDFKALQSINRQADRWLWVPGTNIDYYVIYEAKEGIYEYLWKDIHGNENGTGSVLTPHVPGNRDDAHLLLFGHHMSRRDLMFSNLFDWRDKSYAMANPYVMMYYPDHSECWKVWTCANVQGSSKIYKVPYDIGSKKYAKMLKYTASMGDYELVPTPDRNTRTLYLSTCDTNMGDNDTRFILVCVPDIFYYYDTQTLSRGPLVEEDEGETFDISGESSVLEYDESELEFD